MTHRNDIGQQYRAENGEWAWRIKAPNGEIIAGGTGETYHNLADMTDMLEVHFPNVDWVNLDADSSPRANEHDSTSD